MTATVSAKSEIYRKVSSDLYCTSHVPLESFFPAIVRHLYRSRIVSATKFPWSEFSRSKMQMEGSLNFDIYATSHNINPHWYYKSWVI